MSNYATLPIFMSRQRRARDSNPHEPRGPVDFKSTALPVRTSPPESRVCSLSLCSYSLASFTRACEAIFPLACCHSSSLRCTGQHFVHRRTSWSGLGPAIRGDIPWNVVESAAISRRPKNPSGVPPPKTAPQCASPSDTPPSTSPHRRPFLRCSSRLPLPVR